MIILALVLFATYPVIFSVFKWLTLPLFAYVITAFFAHPAVRSALVSTVVPSLKLSSGYIMALVAVLGTTISPYLFFWQASSEVDEMKAAGLTTPAQRRGCSMQELKAARLDVFTGMLFSNVVMYFIILTSAAVLHAHGVFAIQTSVQAANALRPFAGQYATLLFALGIIGSGFLAVPILAGSAAYATKEFLHLPGSMAVKARFRPTFYGIIVVAMLAGAGINLLHINPIRALFITAVINGVVAPPVLVLIALLAGDRRFMNDKVSGRLSASLTWAAAAIMTVAALALIVTLVG